MKIKFLNYVILIFLQMGWLVSNAQTQTLSTSISSFSNCAGEVIEVSYSTTDTSLNASNKLNAFLLGQDDTTLIGEYGIAKGSSGSVFVKLPVTPQSGGYSIRLEVVNPTHTYTYEKSSDFYLSTKTQITYDFANTVCITDYVPLNADGGGYFSGEGVSDGTFQPSAVGPGNHLIKYTYGGGSGSCQYTDSLYIEVIPSPAVEFTSESITLCRGMVNLNDYVTLKGGQFSINESNISSNLNLSEFQYPEFYLQYNYTDVNTGCSANASTYANVIYNASLETSGEINACSDAPISLSAYTEDASYTKWITFGTGSFSDDTSLNTEYTASNQDANNSTVKLAILYSNGTCAPDTANVYVTFLPRTESFAGADQSVCKNTLLVNLTGTSNFSNEVIWTTSGSGFFIPNSFSLETAYSPSAEDILAGKVSLYLTSIGSICSNAIDTVDINFINNPTIYAGKDSIICTDQITLKATGTPAPKYTWAGGKGSFLNGTESISAEYLADTSEIGKYVTFTVTSQTPGCDDVSDQVLVKFLKMPTSESGLDQSICASTKDVILNGKITNSTGGLWVSTGNGKFIPEAQSIQAIYVPSEEDIAAGTVKLYLNTTGNAQCPEYKDSLKLSIQAQPKVSLGENLVICESDTVINLYAVANTFDVSWAVSGSGGTTKVAPLVLQYKTNAAVILAGKATIIATTTENGICEAGKDTLDIIIKKIPVITLSGDATVCGGKNVSLSGSAINSTNYSWTSSGTGTFVNSNNLTNSYKPSLADNLLNSVTLKLSSVDTICPVVSDSLTVEFKEAPIVDAGKDFSICPDDTIRISAQSLNTDAISWKKGSTTLSSTNSLEYIGTATDKLAGKVSFILTGLNSTSSCANGVDTVTVTYINKSVAVAGNDISICSNTNVKLAGSVQFAKGGKWSGGAGLYVPNANTLNATYIPTASEKQTGALNLILTTTETGSCAANTDTVAIKLTASPFAVAGKNAVINKDGVQLSGKVTNAINGVWSTAGDGTFKPSNADLNASYVPGTADLTSKKVILSLTTEDTSACVPFMSSLILTSNQKPCNVSTSITVSNNTVIFNASNEDDISIGNYTWNFGNGESGKGISQQYTYNAVGTYYSSVFYTTSDSSCTSSKEDTIVITKLNATTRTISGRVKAGKNYADRAIVNLFKFDGKTYRLLKVANILQADSGKYQFKNLNEGYYLVYCILNSHSTEFNNYIATYHKTATKWEDANFIRLTSSDVVVDDISMITTVPASYNSGTGQITGTIVFGELKSARSTEQAEPVEYAVVTLYNNSGDRLTSTYTDPFGHYDFGDLGGDLYSIDVEYAGSTFSEKIDLRVKDDSVSRVDITLDLKELTVGTKDAATTNKCNVYPNPATDRLTIDLPNTNSSEEINIYNNLGILVKSIQNNNNAKSSINIEISSFPSGMYMIEVKSDDKIYSAKFNKQ